MAEPVLVRAYTGDGDAGFPNSKGRSMKKSASLPPITAYSFTNILNAIESPQLQEAIDGIAELCARSNMSLADEYGAHLPPLGEITAEGARANASLVASTDGSGKGGIRPGLQKRRLTTVPEGSSDGGSEGSKGSRSGKRRAGLFGLRWRNADLAVKPMGTVRIGGMGRMVEVGPTTAVVTSQIPGLPGVEGGKLQALLSRPEARRTKSEAEASLHHLLRNAHRRSSSR